MQKYSFKNDYSEGCHQNILDLMNSSNLEQQDGYSEDFYSQKAKEFIKEKIKNPNSKIYLVSGGTQANLLVIGSFLKSYESVICAESGHINIHEAGAIELTGHKVEYIKTPEGKLTKEDIKKVLKNYMPPHTVKPKLVYISNTTEVGTNYILNELKELYDFCQSENLLLFVDGARIFSALAIPGAPSLEDMGKYCDIFYIGATKAGGLIGEAIVINNTNFGEDFYFYMKQRGALLAKGRLLGIQFYELFRENLFLELGQNANKTSNILRSGIKNLGFNFLNNSISNQIFPIFPNEIIKELEKYYGFYVWEKIDEKYSAIRLVTSWNTKEENILKFLEDLKIIIGL